MTITTIVGLIIWILVLVFVIYFIGYRNNKVFEFRTKIIDRCYQGDNWEQKQEIYDNGPSYNEMMFSFKPLKLKSFYTSEEIDILLDLK